MVNALNEALFGPVDEIRTTLQIEGHAELPVTGFRGSDSMSSLANYVVSVVLPEEDLDTLDDLLGREAMITAERSGDDDAIHVMRGVVHEVFPDGLTLPQDQRQCQILVVPHFADLRHTKSSRVFQDLDVIEIAERLLHIWRIELDVRVHPRPLKREFCCQVNESDYAFLTRLFSEEGIHFHIEHRKDKAVLTLVNDPRGYEPMDGEETLPYRDVGGSVTLEHVTRIQRERRVRAGSVAYRDYNWLRPEAELTARKETDKPNEPATLTSREFYEYPGHYNHPDAESAGPPPNLQWPTRSGVDRAMLRLEEQRSEALTFSGTSTCLRLRVGRTFTIKDHRNKSFNRSYIVTHVSIQAESGGIPILGRQERQSRSSTGVVVKFTAVPADARIRPRALPKPAAHLRTARVVGPREDEPFVDTYGRIKVQFAWDREGQRNEKSSCWIRMATSVAHANQGSYIAHRVGAEVLVDFLDGDVDRPVIVGAVFHELHKQPQKLPDDATRAVLYRGLSVPATGGKNEISCEDRAGNEEIFIHAQRDLMERVHRNHTETISANQTSNVGANQTVSIGANQTISVGANRTVSVVGDENIHVTNSRHEDVGDGETVTIKGGRTHIVSTKDESLKVAEGHRSVTVAKDDLLKAKNKQDRITTLCDLQADEKMRIAHKNDAKLILTAGDALLDTDTKITIKTPSGSITIGGGKVAIDAAEELVLTCGNAKLMLKKDGTLVGTGSKEVGLSCSNSQVKLDPAKGALSGASVDVTAVGLATIGGAIIKVG